MLQQAGGAGWVVAAVWVAAVWVAAAGWVVVGCDLKAEKHNNIHTHEYSSLQLGLSCF